MSVSAPLFGDDADVAPAPSPVAEPTAPVAEPTAPFAEPTAPVAETTAPVAEPTCEHADLVAFNVMEVDALAETWLDLFLALL